jgi:hypothetical protein
METHQSDKPDKPDKSDKPDKPDKPDKSDKSDKPDKPDKSDKPKKKVKDGKRRKNRKNIEKLNHRREKLTFINSIRTNYLSWILLFVSISIISYPNLILAYTTFFVLMISAYFWHALSHINKYISIIHHYHHENNNFFSHFGQILIELSLGIVPLICYHCGFKFFDPWIVVYFTLFYTTIHNVNYGTFHVNQVHREHHEELFCNLGPDVCDVLFGTKSPNDLDVENTNHYIPNIIILTILVLILQYVCKNETIFNYLLCLTSVFYILVIAVLGSSTVYLTLHSLYNDLNVNKWLKMVS